MPRIGPFERFPDEYDQWFVGHRFEYERELAAVRELLPAVGTAVEVGVGSGMFAAPLGITLGVDPSLEMASRARKKRIDVALAVAEKLPFDDGSVDAILMVTTICFVDSLRRSLHEARRVLKDEGGIVLGFVDRESPLGLEYLARKTMSRFYGPATFYSTREVTEALVGAGFGDIASRQTLLSNENGPAVISGTGEGSFVVLRGKR